MNNSATDCDFYNCTFTVGDSEASTLSGRRHTAGRDDIYDACKFTSYRFVGSLSGMMLTRSHFIGCDFSAAQRLDEADLRGSFYDSATIWPAGYDPAAHGLISR